MTNSWNSIHAAGMDNYFREAQRLNAMRQRISEIRPTASDLLWRLDAETQQAGFQPWGAASQGLSADEFFRGNTRFNSLEQQLAQRITPYNAADVFDMLKFTGQYTPTRTVMHPIEQSFQHLLIRQTGALPNPAQSSPFILRPEL